MLTRGHLAMGHAEKMSMASGVLAPTLAEQELNLWIPKECRMPFILTSEGMPVLRRGPHRLANTANPQILGCANTLPIFNFPDWPTLSPGSTRLCVTSKPKASSRVSMSSMFRASRCCWSEMPSRRKRASRHSWA